MIRYQLNKDQQRRPRSAGWRELRFLMGNGDKLERRKGVKNVFTLLGRGRRADMDSMPSQTSSTCVFFKKPVILRSVKTL